MDAVLKDSIYAYEQAFVSREFITIRIQLCCQSLEALTHMKKMDQETKVEIILRESIKPSSPTPDHLKNYKLSLIDQVTPNMDVPMILFYPIPNGLTVEANFVSERSNHLKTSLSQTLSHFYPFAGRLKNNFWVDCNDDGVDYIQAKVHYPMSKVLEKPNPDMLKQLLPLYVESKEIATTSLLLVQVNFFQCGGIAIGLSISHKIADASSLSTFINNWAATTFACGESVLPIFGSDSHFPPLDFLSSQLPVVESHTPDKCSTRRYVFDASKIASLQLKLASTTVPNPTRVEAVSALIWKCAMEASRSNSGCLRPSVLCQVVNTRKRLVPPLPDNLIGNLVGFYTSKTEEIEINLQELVAKLRKGMQQVCENYKTGVGSEEIQQGLVEYGSLIKNEDIDCYSCTSWCKFPLYDADFGWGKPTWVSIASVTFNNVIQLMDTKDGGGIEAWLVFKDEDVALIERNQDLQAFARLNPSIP